MLALQPTTYDPAGCLSALLEQLNGYCTELTGDEERDVQRFEGEFVDGGGEDDGIYIHGYHDSICRLYFHLSLDAAPNEVEISLRATKGSRDIYDADWGTEGPQVGNSVLIARLLHVGICTLRSQGVRALVNEPYTRKLEAYYTSMGFERGRRLSLSDPDALDQAFNFIAALYVRFRIDLNAPPP